MGDVTPHNGAGRVVASLVMLTAIPLLASVFALASGGFAAAGVRRILAMRSHFPEGPYRLVIGMNETVPAIVDELVAAGVAVVLVADVDPASLPPGSIWCAVTRPTRTLSSRPGRKEPSKL